MDATRDVAAPRARHTAGLIACIGGPAAAVALLGNRTLAIVPRDAATARSTGIDRWVEIAILGIGVTAAAWVLLSAIVAVLCVLLARGRDAGRTVDAVLGRWTPVVVRRLARGAVGVGVGAGLALTPVAAVADDVSPAEDGVVLDLGWQSTTDEPQDDGPQDDGPQADESADRTESGGSDASSSDAGSSETDGSGADDHTDRATEPDDGTGPGHIDVADAEPAAREVAPPSDTHVVVRGDTLWDIAAGTLDPDADDAEVMRATTRWHEANRDVIGDDPDLIRPGQSLQAP